MKTHRGMGRAVLGSALWITLVSPSAFAGENAPLSTLSADNVADRAERTNTEVQLRNADVITAAAQLDQAVIAFFPKLQLVARLTRLSDIDAPLLGYSLVAPNAPKAEGPVAIAPGTPLIQVPTRFPVLLNQATFQGVLTVPVSDYFFRLTQAHDAASKSRDSADLLSKATRLKARAEAKLAYYSWARATLTESVVQNAVTQARDHLGDVQKAFDAGGASKADVLRLESQVAQAEQMAARAKNLTEVLGTQLRTLMHGETDEPLRLAEDFSQDLELAQAEPLGKIVAEAMQRRLELKSLSESKAALHKQVQATKAVGYPRVDVLGEVTAANPNQRFFPPEQKFMATWSLSAQLTWTPNDTFSASAAAKAVDAKGLQVEAQRKAFEDALRMELGQAIESRGNAAAAQSTSKRSLVAAEESYRVRRSLFQNGRATSVELLDAANELTKARMDVVAAHIDARVAEVRYSHATGRDVR